MPHTRVRDINHKDQQAERYLSLRKFRSLWKDQKTHGCHLDSFVQLSR